MANQDTQDRLDRAISICDHEYGDATSGRYQNFQIVTVKSILQELREHVLAALNTSLSEPAASELRNLDQRLRNEYGDAASGRWKNYRASTMADLMSTFRDSLRLAKQLDGGDNGDPVRALISKAVAICDHEIEDARSGAYQNYQLRTVVSLLERLIALTTEARDRTPSQDAASVLRNLIRRLSYELNDARSGRWEKYRVSTIATMMAEYRADYVQAGQLHLHSR